jgi:hypothetical protein
MTEDEAFAAIRDGWDAEIARPTDPGSANAIN